MRTIVFAMLLLVGARAVRAQPGQDPAPQPDPQPQPSPQPQPFPNPQPQRYAPQPYAYQPPPRTIALSSDDQDILERGEISDGEYIAGGAVSLFFGFGAGQAIQGRWHDTGWIFSLGEAASVAALLWGVGVAFQDCAQTDVCDGHRGETQIWVGAIGLAGFRVWEVIDAFSGPPEHNRRFHQLQDQLGRPRTYYGPYLAPPHSGAGGVAGIAIRF
ncbi:MAG: hypothetical protein JWO36_5202 [Myxococcales bacterium]|nr:hypothetical protein [Myxococcales bacterium]